MKHVSVVVLCAALASCAPIQQARAIGAAVIASASGKLNTTNPVAFSPDGRYIVAVDEVGDCYAITLNDTTTNIRIACDCIPKSLQLVRYSEDGTRILASGPGWGVVYSADKLEVKGEPVNQDNYFGQATVNVGDTWVTSKDTYDAISGVKVSGATQQSGSPILSFIQADQTYVIRQDDATIRIYLQQSSKPVYSTPGKFVGYLDGTLLARQDKKLVVQKPFNNETVNVFDLDEADHLDNYVFYSNIHKQESALMSADSLAYLQTTENATKVVLLNLKTGENTLLATVDSTSCVVPDRAHQRVALCDSGQLVSLSAAK